PIPGSDLQLKVDRLPLMGSHEAPRRIGLLFDYTCPDCRQQHGYIREAVEKFDGKLSCLMIPMPLDKNCNDLIEETYPVQIDACEYAKICLAVHQVAADKYDSFDRWLFSDRDEKKELNEVRKYAAELVGAEKLEKALSSEALQEQLKQNILIYKLNYEKNTVIPQTIVHDHMIFGLSESAEKLQSELQRILKLKSVKLVKAKEPVLETEIVGTYDLRYGENIFRVVFQEGGIVIITNDKKETREYKWKIEDGEVHVEYEDFVGVYRIG
ncbi:uncharacterized protein METZ01_LOCUS428074, partial [marine metagenome]